MKQHTTFPNRRVSRKIGKVSRSRRGGKVSKYTIDKFLSEGLMGKVYLVHDRNRKTYAMKVEYISDKNDRYLRNELRFVKEVARKYPEQFIQLVDYRIVEDCKAEAPPMREWVKGKELEWFTKLRASGVCVEKVYSLIDTSLDHLPISKMTLPQRYSMLIQTLYISYLFEKHGFVHGDFHHGNIGVLRVSPKKTVKIFGQHIPTFGYQYQAIDYGGILHKTTASKTHRYQQRAESEYQHFQEHSLADKLGLIGSMWDEKPFWKFIEKNKVKMKGYDHDLALIQKQKQIEYINTISTNKWIQFDLFKLLFPTTFQRVILGKHFQKTIDFTPFIPLVDIVYCLMSIDNLEHTIGYLIERMNEIEK